MRLFIVLPLVVKLACMRNKLALSEMVCVHCHEKSLKQMLYLDLQFFLNSSG